MNTIDYDKIVCRDRACLKPTLANEREFVARTERLQLYRGRLLNTQSNQRADLQFYSAASAAALIQVSPNTYTSYGQASPLHDKATEGPVSRPPTLVDSKWNPTSNRRQVVRIVSLIHSLKHIYPFEYRNDVQSMGEAIVQKCCVAFVSRVETH